MRTSEKKTTVPYTDVMLEMLPAWEMTNPPDIAYGLSRAYRMLQTHLLGDDANVVALRNKIPIDLSKAEFDGRSADSDQRCRTACSGDSFRCLHRRYACSPGVSSVPPWRWPVESVSPDQLVIQVEGGRGRMAWRLDQVTRVEQRRGPRVKSGAGWGALAGVLVGAIALWTIEPADAVTNGVLPWHELPVLATGTALGAGTGSVINMARRRWVVVYQRP